jgi:hypothetical protein
MHLVDSLSCGGAGIGLDAGWWQRRVCGSWQWSHGAAPIGRPAAPLIQGHSILVPLPFNFDGNLMLISKIESYMVILPNVDLLRNHSRRRGQGKLLA